MKKTDTETRERKQMLLCDQIVCRAATLMQNDVGAPLGMIIDRLLTYAGAQAASDLGSVRAAAIFRALADNVDAGVFHRVTGEGGRRH